MLIIGIRTEVVKLDDGFLRRTMCRQAPVEGWMVRLLCGSLIGSELGGGLPGTAGDVYWTARSSLVGFTSIKILPRREPIVRIHLFFFFDLFFLVLFVMYRCMILR